MNPRYKPLLLGAAVIALGALLVMLLPRKPATAVAGNDLQTVAQADVAAVADASTQMAVQAQTEAFPWERNATRGNAAPVVAAVAAPPAMMPALDEPSLAAVRQQVVQSQQATEGLLQKIDQMEASGQVPKDVDLGALRTNVAIARRAQTLTLELLALNQQPDSTARAQRAQAIVTELQQLQTSLRTDVTSGNVPAAH